VSFIEQWPSLCFQRESLHLVLKLNNEYVQVIFHINKSSQIYFFIVLFTIQIVSKLLHNINQDNLTVFVYPWKKRQSSLVELINDGSFNLNIPN